MVARSGPAPWRASWPARVVRWPELEAQRSTLGARRWAPQAGRWPSGAKARSWRRWRAPASLRASASGGAMLSCTPAKLLACIHLGAPLHCLALTLSNSPTLTLYLSLCLRGSSEAPLRGGGGASFGARWRLARRANWWQDWTGTARPMARAGPVRNPVSARPLGRLCVRAAKWIRVWKLELILRLLYLQPASERVGRLRARLASRRHSASEHSGDSTARRPS